MELSTDILRREHHRMERRLERFEGELGNPQGKGLVALARTFAEIQAHLASHVRKEEEVFYPALAPMLTATDMEIGKLLDAHADIRETSAAFQDLLDRAQAAEVPDISVRADLSSIGWELWNLIHHHITEEENGLLAFADRQLDSSTQAQLALRMQTEG